MVETVNGETCLLVSQKKWDGVKKIIVRIQEKLRDMNCLNHKQLEQDRGFLIYISRTYRSMTPDVKEIHYTL